MNETEKEHADESVKFTIRITPDAEMPDGLNVVPVELDGQLTVCIRERHISEEAHDEFNAFMNHATRHGLLTQTWGGPGKPEPPHDRR